MSAAEAGAEQAKAAVSVCVCVCVCVCRRLPALLPVPRCIAYSRRASAGLQLCCHEKQCRYANAAVGTSGV